MSQRSAQLLQLSEDKHDVLIIGGGINGASCAASLSAAGLKVVLVERRDFASETSQQSSNLIWGGIKYLQNGSFRLVSKLCRSRNILMESYPSSVREIRYFTILQKSSPPRLWFYLGTWIYWLFGRGFTQKPKLLSPREIRKETGAESVGGVEYSDAYLPDNDTRFTFNFIRSAWKNGALAINYLEAVRCERKDGIWVATLRDEYSWVEYEVKSDIILNAAGPMVDELNLINGIDTKNRIVFSKGVHLIVPRIAEVEKVMTFFADDGRLFFAVPMGPCTCIGTTDTPQDSWTSKTTKEDVEFILSNINARLKREMPLTEKDVISTRCGVRPLAVKKGEKNHGDWLKLSRKHITEVDQDKRYVSIYGGKLTDCINVGNELIEICSQFGYSIKRNKWYAEDKGREEFLAKAISLRSNNLDGIGSKVDRLWRRYGKEAYDFLSMIEEDADLANEAIEGTGVLKVEVVHAANHEMVVTLEDFLRRRTNLALCYRLCEREDELLELSRMLFGEQAEVRLCEYQKLIA
jgi:glycerol-3-phosphate dehydrogenase